MTDPANDSPTAVNVTHKSIDETDFLDGIVVLPTGPVGRYTDIALTGLFSAQLANINVGKRLIWQRYYVFLAANSGLVAFVGSHAEMSMWFAIGLAAMGVGMCIAWWILTGRSWAHNIRYIQVARRFEWNVVNRVGKHVELNPLADEYYNYIDDWEAVKWKKDKIYVVAMILVAVSGVMHIVALLSRLSAGGTF